MKTRLLTTCIGITIGVSSLLGNTSAMSAAVNANDNEHGYGLTFDAPFDETSRDGMPTAINTWLEANNLGENGDHSPDLPGQAPTDAPNDVPRNIPDIPDNDPDHDNDHNEGIGTELHGWPDTDDMRSLVESWQEDHLIGLYNTHNENTDGLTLTTSSTTITSAPGSLITVSAVPVPAAVWLFGSGLLGLIGIANRKKA
ncbi:MAG: VPLPA-CTERM sorting domain-containing protein [Gammaproteobacteria bacterium]|nr:VPLPA-CTERM sorting domain-containing protein [Gammaproteobacteria bacterium]